MQHIFVRNATPTCVARREAQRGFDGQAAHRCPPDGAAVEGNAIRLRGPVGKAFAQPLLVQVKL
jgi:hypothetical protein